MRWHHRWPKHRIHRIHGPPLIFVYIVLCILYCVFIPFCHLSFISLWWFVKNKIENQVKMISMQCFGDKLGILSSSRTTETTETTEFLQQELGWLKLWNCSPLVARSHCVLCVFLFPVVWRRSQLWKTRRTKCSGRRSSGTRHAPSRQNPAWRHIATWRRRGRQRNSECCGS